MPSTSGAAVGSTEASAVPANPIAMAVRGLVIACLSMAGSALLPVGLAVVIPVLGHASWHPCRPLVF